MIAIVFAAFALVGIVRTLALLARHVRRAWQRVKTRIQAYHAARARRVDPHLAAAAANLALAQSIAALAQTLDRGMRQGRR